MSKTNILFIGLDTHKEFCQVAYCEDSRESIPTSFGRIKTTKQAITKFARQMQSKYPTAVVVVAGTVMVTLENIASKCQSRRTWIKPRVKE